MNKKLRFIWIDDDGDRETASKTLERKLGVKCLFINLKKIKNFDEEVISRNNPPNFILIDHNLTNNKSNDIKKGSTIAAYLRDQWANSPIVCITGQNSSEIDSQQRALYEDVFGFDEIASSYSSMKSIAESYSKLKNASPKNTNEILKLLKAPTDEHMRLVTIMPHELKSNFSDHGLLPSISHWVRNVLIERPGFLYDRLWAATLLGIKEKSFKKVEELFEPAKYKGIFKDDSKERWWKSELMTILSKNVSASGLPWEKGRHLSKISKGDYSRDYYSNGKEDLPEIVAYIDDNSKVREQMKLKYTIPHPKYEDLLFFEEIRMMKA